MNEQHEYLTVPEFAERAGVTKQAVYSRIKSGGIDGYISEEGGKKRISTAALSFFAPRQENGKVDSQEQTTLPGELTEVDRQVDGQEQSNSDKLIEALTAEIRGLREQVAEQSKREDELLSQLKEKDDKLMEYADKFAELSRQTAELANKAISTTGQAQMLHAHAVAEEETEPVVIAPASVTSEVKASQSKIVKFLSRIFKIE